MASFLVRPMKSCLEFPAPIATIGPMKSRQLLRSGLSWPQQEAKGAGLNRLKFVEAVTS